MMRPEEMTAIAQLAVDADPNVICIAIITQEGDEFALTVSGGYPMEVLLNLIEVLVVNKESSIPSDTAILPITFKNKQN